MNINKQTNEKEQTSKKTLKTTKKTNPKILETHKKNFIRNQD